MKLKAALILLAFLSPTILAEQPEPRVARFKCSRFIQPRIHCEASSVWPILPYWQVYYPGTEDVVEYDQGIVVYLTLPRENFARIEMCLDKNQCLVAYGGWFGDKL